MPMLVLVLMDRLARTQRTLLLARTQMDNLQPHHMARHRRLMVRRIRVRHRPRTLPVGIRVKFLRLLSINWKRFAVLTSETCLAQLRKRK